MTAVQLPSTVFTVLTAEQNMRQSY